MNASVLNILEKKGKTALEDYLSMYSLKDHNGNIYELQRISGNRDSEMFLHLRTQNENLIKYPESKAASLKAVLKKEISIWNLSEDFIENNYHMENILLKNVPYKAFRSHNGRVFYFDDNLIFRSRPYRHAIGKIDGVYANKMDYPGLQIGLKNPLEMKIAASRLQDGDNFYDFLFLLMEAKFVPLDRAEKRLEKALIYKNPQIIKEYGNYSSKYFDYITMEIYIISAVGNRDTFCRKFRNDILRRSVKTIAQMKTFKSYGFTPKAIVLTSMKLLPGGILELTFELKPKYRNIKKKGNSVKAEAC